MKVAVPKEIKKHEYRVGLTPANVSAYVRAGHSVAIEENAGDGAGFSDTEYLDAGACIVSCKETLFADAEMIIKVKEPLEQEYDLFHEGQILYTYLHLAADKKQTEALLAKKVVGIAYETIQLEDGSLPCLTPMSEIAGRLATQEGAKYLEKCFGGRGVLLGGVPGVRRGKVAVVGGGVVGLNAAKIAIGMGADVTILDISAKRLAYIDDIYGNKIQTLYSNEENIIDCLKESDLVIGAVLLPGAKAPKLIKRDMLKYMKPGAVIVDVAVDQGGCVETTHATSHDDPIFIVDGIVHYCVANMPGAVALTSTLALTNTTLPYGLKIANLGWRAAVAGDAALKKGLNLVDGKLCYEPVAKSLSLPFEEI
ncbi:MAG: alanine dehydrogenase [Lentisphaeraceae bacterium]|nr:alanine dehydrogenase [Lentisphaeraceae bacterium]